MMRNMKRKRNTVNVPGSFLDKDLIYEHDERLGRRLKRRCATDNTFEDHCADTGVKRTVGNNQCKNTGGVKRTINKNHCMSTGGKRTVGNNQCKNTGGVKRTINKNHCTSTTGGGKRTVGNNQYKNTGGVKRTINKNHCTSTTGGGKRTVGNDQCKNTGGVKRTINKNHCMSITGGKRTLDNAQKREVLVDSDYALYLNLRGWCEDDCVDDHDPDYVMCLTHLKEYGSSYALEIDVNNGMPLLLKYEEEDEFEDDLKRKSSKFVKDFLSKDRVKTKRVLRNTTREEKKKSRNTMRSVLRKGTKIAIIKEDAKAKCMANGSASQKPGPKVRYSSQPETNNDMGFDMDDDSYENFLNCLKLDGDTLVLVKEDGKQLRYENDDENASDSDSDIVATVDVPHCDEGIHCPFVPSKIYYLDCKESSSRTNSKFSEKLMDILIKPFDKKEYLELLQEASDRKPLERHIELRRGVTKRCPMLENLGKSYLDHYADLKNEIDSVGRNRYIVLKLLRGFFYWLKNLSQEGAFRPWLDESCLQLIRQL